MLVLKKVSASYRTPGSSTTRRLFVLNGVNAVFNDGDHVAILGAGGAGKTTLLRLLCGMLRPSGGRILRESTVSFPVGFSGATHRMTVGQYVHFIAKCYSVDHLELRDFVVEFTGMKEELKHPCDHLASNMKSKLNYLLGYALPFDFYLFDGRVAVGEPEFRKTCLRLFDARRESSGVVLTTRDPRLAREYCRSGGVLHNGSLVMFGDVEQAISYYTSIIPHALPAVEDPYYRPTAELEWEE